jgi:cyclophilin family peptidyl-prolyl cis-trans isomerase
MGGHQGLATLQDWGRRRAETLTQAQSGFSALGGNQVYMDLVVGDRSEAPMRLCFMLFDQNPLAFGNFHALCTHSVPGLGEAGRQLSYRRSKVHRISKGAFFEAGDITIGDGRGGDSIFGAAGFEQERFGLNLSHDGAGLLCMAPSAAGRSQSRFRVTFGPVPALDGVSAVIGRLVSGAAHLATIEGLPVDAEERPVRQVTIVECGPVQGWATLPPPMPRDDNATARATLDGVGSAAAALRDSVASAVQAALGGGTSSSAVADDGSRADSAAGPRDASGGKGEDGAAGGQQGKKRAASSEEYAPSSSGGGAAPPPPTKRTSAMMALPFEEEMGTSDDSDDGGE